MPPTVWREGRVNLRSRADEKKDIATLLSLGIVAEERVGVKSQAVDIKKSPEHEPGD